MGKRIISIQDISCLGQCSLTVALPILSALGIECAILPNAMLSTHTGGFKEVKVFDLNQQIQQISACWLSQGFKFDGIYSGYVNNVEQFKTILNLTKLLLADGLFIVDPAIADDGKLYQGLNIDIVEGMRELVSIADVIIPNLTEAYFLLNKPYKENPSRAEVEELLFGLANLGPCRIIITGVSFLEEQIGAICLDKEKMKIDTYFTKRLPKSYHGTGDIFSSVVVADLLNGKSTQEAIKDACEFTYRCIEKTLDDSKHYYGVHFEDVLHELILNNK